MLIGRALFVLVVITLVTLLFREASGGLRLTNLNMISALYYYVLVFNLIGASLIFLGFRKHYLVQRIRHLSTIDRTYYVVAYSLIMFPLVLIVMKRIVEKVAGKTQIIDFVKSGIYYNSYMVNTQKYVLILMAICTLATVYVFLNLGYIPIMAVLQGQNLDALRQSGSHAFGGNQYIKNLLMYALTPFVSYMTYVYYRLTHSTTWRLGFMYMALLSIIVLTYDFSKSPIITYLIGFYLLEVVLGRISNIKSISKMGIVIIAIILFFYVIILGAGGSLTSIYTGPVGRILFTQIATLFLHIEAFPVLHPFLHGASFSRWMSFMIPAAEGLRSGRVVMSIYNPTGVETNTAGVMNTLFVGEAYANMGMLGVIIAPIVFGFVIGLFAYAIPNFKKTPLTVLLYVQMTLQFITIVEGGFIDIFYSASTLFIILFVILSKLITGPHNSKIKTVLGCNNCALLKP